MIPFGARIYERKRPHGPEHQCSPIAALIAKNGTRHPDYEPKYHDSRCDLIHLRASCPQSSSASRVRGKTAKLAGSPARHLGQLSNIYRNAPRLVATEHLGCRAAPRLFLVINVSQLLAAAVLHDEGRIDVLDGPLRREAAGKFNGVRRVSDGSANGRDR